MARIVSRRVVLVRATMPHGYKSKTLQDHLQAALPPTINLDRTSLSSAQFGELRINEAPKPATTGGLKIKIVGHAKEERATTVPLKRSAAKKAESSAKAPKLQSYKNADFFMIVRKNMIVGLGDHMRIETAIKYLAELLNKRLSTVSFAAMDTTSIFTYDAAKKLADGVRSIEFDANLSHATVAKINDQKYRGPIRTLIQSLTESMASVGTKEADASGLADVSVSISVSARGGIHASEQAQKAIEGAAKTLLSDVEAAQDPIGATIVTKRGDRVSLTTSTVGRDYRLQRRQNENSVIDLAAWDALEEFNTYVQSLGDLQT